MNSPNDKRLTHDRLGSQFDDIMNQYDLNRRLDILIDEFLASVDLNGKRVLDAGCGTGRGTARLADEGAEVIAFDFGMSLLRHTSANYRCTPVNGDALSLPFAPNQFDVVFSSEMIEHTHDPLQAVREMLRVLKPEGHLVLSTPNWLWQIPVQIASQFKLRPYDGIENFVKPADLRATVATNGTVLAHKGLHLIPFQITALQSISHYFDQFGATLLPVMINQCIHAQKHPS